MICILPIYKSKLSLFEHFSLNRINLLYPNELVVICPKSFCPDFLKKYVGGFSVIKFDDNYFHGLSGYNRLLLSEEFYLKFIQHEYIQIVQLDVYLFSNDLSNWINKKYSYVGAPMPKEIIEGIRKKYSIDFHQNISYRTDIMFNGGYSLRKVSDFIEIIKMNKEVINEYLANGWFEDSVFSILFSNSAHYKLPEMNQAQFFSIEAYPLKHFIEMNYTLPLGCHAWYRNDNRIYNNFFWFKIIAKNQNKAFYYPYSLLIYYYYLLIHDSLIKKTKRLITYIENEIRSTHWWSR